MNNRKLSKEAIAEIKSLLSEALAEGAIKNELKSVKIRNGMTKKEVEEAVQTIGRAYNAVIRGTIVKLLDEIQDTMSTCHLLMDKINEELGIELVDEDDEDDD